jgi:hypothetical protein
MNKNSHSQVVTSVGRENKRINQILNLQKTYVIWMMMWLKMWKMMDVTKNG